jgi:hypothetical protein
MPSVSPAGQNIRRAEVPTRRAGSDNNRDKIAIILFFDIKNVFNKILSRRFIYNLIIKIYRGIYASRPQVLYKIKTRR